MSSFSSYQFAGQLSLYPRWGEDKLEMFNEGFQSREISSRDPRIGNSGSETASHGPSPYTDPIRNSLNILYGDQILNFQGVGDTGGRGKEGATGVCPPGEIGPPGFPGPIGDPGADGAQGGQGAAGVNGLPGAQGYVGRRGPAGDAGESKVCPCTELEPGG